MAIITESSATYDPIAQTFVIDKKSYLENVNHIICISQNTKKDLINYYGEKFRELIANIS